MVMNIREDRGFTFVEVIVAVSITAILAMMAMGLLQNTFKNFYRHQNVVDEQDNLRAVVSKMSKYVLQGTIINTYTTNFSFNTYTFTGPIGLNIAGDAVQIDSKYTIYLDNAKIIQIRDINANTQFPISKSVSMFSVSKVYSTPMSPSNSEPGQYLHIIIKDKNNKYFLDTYLSPRNR